MVGEFTMAFILGSLLNPLVNLLALAVLVLAIQRIRKQKMKQFQDAKILLLLADYFFLGVVILEFFRNFYPTALVMLAYAHGAVVLVLSDVIFLTALAYVIYIRPPEPTFKERLAAFLGPRLWPHGILLLSFSAYILFVICYLFVFEPFRIVMLNNLAGYPVASTQFERGFIFLLFLVLGIFVAYPCTQLLLASRRPTEIFVRHSLRIFTISWVLIGFALLTLNGYLANVGYDTSAFGYLIVAMSFSTSVLVFGRATLLEEFFQPTRSMEPISVASPSLRSTEVRATVVEGTAALLEVDSSSNYEQFVRDFATEEISKGSLFYVFTSKGSRVWGALSAVTGVRLLTITGEVSYPKATDRSYEMLLPRGDEAALLDSFDKVLSSNPESKVAFVFDSLSDTVLSFGFERSYKLLKQVLEIISRPRVTAVFLIFVGTHDDTVRNLLLSLFGDHLIFDSAGLKIGRMPLQ